MEQCAQDGHDKTTLSARLKNVDEIIMYKITHKELAVPRCWLGRRHRLTAQLVGCVTKPVLGLVRTWFFVGLRVDTILELTDGRELADHWHQSSVRRSAGATVPPSVATEEAVCRRYFPAARLHAQWQETYHSEVPRQHGPREELPHPWRGTQRRERSALTCLPCPWFP